MSIAAIRTVGARFGVDRAVVYALAVRAWQVAAGPVTIALVAWNLDPEQQGFYFTFASVLALQVFFEMGLSLVIQQFVSHEVPKLKWTSVGIDGDPTALNRLRALMRSALQWFGIAATLFGLGVLLAGLFFFAGEDETRFVWRLPWALLVFTTSMNMLFIPFVAALEGGGRIVEVNSLRLAQAVGGNLAVWLTLWAGGGLYAAAAMSGIAVGTTALWILTRHRPFIAFVLNKKSRASQTPLPATNFSWKAEVWPMQWRIAISWMSGYLISQLFTPVLFHFHGAVEAGRMGMTLVVANGVTSVALIWINVRMWTLGGLIAAKNWAELDALFFRLFWQSFTVVLIGASLVIAFVFSIATYPIGARFLGPTEVTLLMLSVVVNHVIASLAQYLRAHKQEPFVWLSVLGGAMVGISTWWLGSRYASFGMVSGLLLINLLYGLPTAILLWRRLRTQWHVPDSAKIPANAAPQGYEGGNT